MDLINDNDPGTAVLQRLSQTQLKRKQQITKDELDTITARVEKTLKEYDKTSDLKHQASKLSSLDLLDDLINLEEVLKDSLLKNEYQQNLSLFIVRYKGLCTKRLDILNQINEFFNINSENDGNDLSISDSHIDNLGQDVEDILSTMEVTLKHLDDTSRNVLQYMGHLHNLNSKKPKKSKKKLEKVLLQNKNEIEKMSGKIKELQHDVKVRDEKIEILKGQLDTKKSEITMIGQQLMSLRTSCKVTEENLKEEIKSMKKESEALKNQPTQNETPPEGFPKRAIYSRLAEIRETGLNELYTLKERMLTEHLETPFVESEIAEHFRVQLQQMKAVYGDELDEWRKECIVHIKQVLDIEVNEEESIRWMDSPNKEKPASPYQTSSACSATKPPSNDGDSRIVTPNEKPADVRKIKFEDEVSCDDVALMKAKLHSAGESQQLLKDEISKMKEENVNLLKQISSLQHIQEETEKDALLALEKLEMMAADGSGGEISHETAKPGECNEKSGGVNTESRTDSPSTLSKPASPSTGHSLVSAYRQKIADRRNTINKQMEMTQDTNIETKSLDSKLLEQHLQAYRAVISFKDKVAEEMSRHSIHQDKAQILNDLQISDFNAASDHIQVHALRMTSTIKRTLETIYKQFKGTFISSDPSNFQHQITLLEENLLHARGAYERRSQHDAGMIMQTQNQQNETQRGNTTAVGALSSGIFSSPTGPVFGKSPGLRPDSRELEQTVLFTRQDAQHNEIALRKAAAAGRIASETLEAVSNTMEAYNTIPQKRIGQLARKLVHHTTMKQIETSVRNSNLVSSEVFTILEKMETLQQRRAQRWSHDMDRLSSERHRLALLLFDALHRLETVTGVFLIKPILSYKGKGPMKKYTGKISTRFNKYQTEAMLQKMLAKKVSASPSEMPTSQKYSRREVVAMNPTNDVLSGKAFSVSGFQGPVEEGLWRINESVVPKRTKEEIGKKETIPSMDIPRIMELDVLRYQPVSISRGYTPLRPGGTRLVKTVDNPHRPITRGFSENVKSRSSYQSRSAPGNKYSPDYKSNAPPTTPASPLVDRYSIPLTEYDEDNMSLGVLPLPPIRRSSNRSILSSPASTIPYSLTPSKSAADVRDTNQIDLSPIASSRKEISTSSTCQ